MSPEIVFGNAPLEGAARGGWFVGHFLGTDAGLRSTAEIEVKWGVHAAGEARSEWSIAGEAQTLSILISGRFRLQFVGRDCVLSQPGDYVLWAAGVPHGWTAEEASTILTIRWPSKPGDSVPFSRDQLGS